MSRRVTINFKKHHYLKDHFSFYVEISQSSGREARRWEGTSREGSSKLIQGNKREMNLPCTKMAAVTVTRNGLILIKFKRQSS